MIPPPSQAHAGMSVRVCAMCCVSGPDPLRCPDKSGPACLRVMIRRQMADNAGLRSCRWQRSSIEYAALAQGGRADGAGLDPR